MNGKFEFFSAKSLALVGIMAATLECGKLALSFLPNIEVVTILLALYGYVFGWYGVAAAVVFVCLEPLIWGVGGWIVTYIIYWPAVAIVFMLLSGLKIKNRWVIASAAVILTIIFGGLSSVVDVIFYLGINRHFFVNILIYYTRGVVFYIVQIVCNATLFIVTFNYLESKLSALKRRFLL